LDGSTSTSQSHGIFFGEYEYVGSGFEYNVAVICSGSSITYNPRLGAQYSYATGISGSSGHYMARSPFATVGSHAFHKCQLTYGGGIQTNTACPIGVQTGPINQPDAVSGNIRFTRLQILCGDPVYSIAGYLPGFWGALVNVGIGGAANSEANHMLIDGSGELEGHQLLLLVTGAGINTSTSFGVYNAQIALDITAWP
jgi:hypothetical protein